MNRLGWSIRPWTDEEHGGGVVEREDLRLLEPAEWMRAEYLAYIEDFRLAGEPNHGDHRDLVIADFPAFLARCRDFAAGRNLPEGYVPQTDYWLFRGNVLVATCRLRHRLNEHLSQHGGHIGYDVRPAERRHGYATKMLAMVLDKARQLGLSRVMLTCDKQNIASARTIQRNGGVLEREYWFDVDGRQVLVQNYWIDLN